MPSIVTHHLFAKDVLESLPHSIKETITQNIETYLIFAQSFDNLFYYHFLFPITGQKIRQLGIDAQKIKTDIYFKKIIENIKKKHLENNDELLAFLYGSVTHYILDYHCHPFVFYYTNDVNLNLKYRGLHAKMEVNLDAYMLKKRENKALKDEQLANILLPKIKFSKELKSIMDNVYLQTFNVKNMGTIYEKSVQNGNFILKNFVTDKMGIKKKLYRLKDNITFLSKRRYEYLSFHVTEINRNYLNEKHDLWLNPWSGKESNQSFNDLYEEALDNALNAIKIIDNYFANKVSLNEVMNILKDYSYLSGISWHDNKPLIYSKI